MTENQEEAAPLRVSNFRNSLWTTMGPMIRFGQRQAMIGCVKVMAAGTILHRSAPPRIEPDVRQILPWSVSPVFGLRSQSEGEKF